MPTSDITVNMRVGHLSRTTAALAKAAHGIGRELAELSTALQQIPINYCEYDGEELVFERIERMPLAERRTPEDERTIIHKHCPRCGEHFMFRD